MNHDDELDERINDLAGKALKIHDDTPLLSVLGHLYDTRQEFAGEAPLDYVSGYAQAVHDVEYMYATHTDDLSCGCDDRADRFAEARADDRWVCATCDETLVVNLEEKIKQR